ncbi:MAG TPA: hypothetical protein VKT99_14360 [Xanthobacteraceae bacterium]|jgi:hypothetical protein|nr:hypothetical protein [Xanthobacteraceae bacterium]
MPRHVSLRNVAIAAIAAFVIYGEYAVWIKSPAAQIAAICDNLRTLKRAALRNTEPLRLVDEASAETLEPLHLITQAVRACDGEAIDIEDSDIR